MQEKYKTQMEFADAFYKECAHKFVSIYEQETEVDGLSLLEWFLDYGYTNKLNKHTLENFVKVFAQLMFVEYLKESKAFIEIESDVPMEEIKKAIDKLGKKHHG